MNLQYFYRVSEQMYTIFRGLLYTFVRLFAGFL